MKQLFKPLKNRGVRFFFVGGSYGLGAVWWLATLLRLRRTWFIIIIIMNSIFIPHFKKNWNKSVWGKS